MEYIGRRRMRRCTTTHNYDLSILSILSSDT